MWRDIHCSQLLQDYQLEVGRNNDLSVDDLSGPLSSDVGTRFQYEMVVGRQNIRAYAEVALLGDDGLPLVEPIA